MKPVRILLFCFCLFLLSSCGSNQPKDLIIGKWEMIQGEGEEPVMEEFTRDGKVITYASGKKFKEGAYKVTDDNKIEFMEKPGVNPHATYRLKVTANEMTLISGDNQEEKFKRVQ